MRQPKQYYGALLLGLLLLSCAFANAQMRQIHTDNTGQNSQIPGMSFYSPSEGFFAYINWLTYTSDSGHTMSVRTFDNLTWNGVPVAISLFSPRGVRAYSYNRIYSYGVFGTYPCIVSSTDGGSSFIVRYMDQAPNANNEITDLSFPGGGNTGYATDSSHILKTVDGGQTWTVLALQTNQHFEHIEAIDNNHVYVVSPGLIKKTSDGGQTWQNITPPSGQFYWASFLDASKGWAQAGHLYYTSDGGATWTVKDDLPVRTNLDYDLWPRTFVFVNDSTGIGNSGSDIVKTTDSGRRWERVPNLNPVDHPLSSMFVRNGSQFWSASLYSSIIELNTNGTGPTIPVANFAADLSLYNTNRLVQLVNYSKPGYTFRWLVNGSQISTAYNSSYIHDRFHPEDTVTLIVKNPAYADTQKVYLSFNPPVVVSSFSPTSAHGGGTVTITGLNLDNASAVSFGGTPAASFQVLSSTSIRAVVANGSSGYVKVVTPIGMDSLAGFTYLPTPSITAVSPASATAGSTITITGSHFTGVTSVNFGGTPAASFTVVSDNTIQAVLGTGATGILSVTSPDGRAETSFVVIPVFSSFTPASGTWGTYMTITGTGLAGVTAITVGGTPVASFTIQGNTSITAVLAAGAAGSVQLTAPGGPVSLPGFIYYEPPHISSFTPLKAATGASMTITGDNFNPNPTDNIVYIAGVKATVVSGTGTSLVVTIPPACATGIVSVTTHQLTAYSAQSFVTVFPNGGSLTGNSFAAPQQLAVNGTAGSESVADIDGDGKADLIVLNQPATGPALVSIYRNTSTLTAISFAPPVSMAVTSGPMEPLDFDGDGKLDLVCPGTSAAILINQSTPGTISFSAAVNLGANVYVTAMMDIDQDGKPDLIMSDNANNVTAVYRNVSNPGAPALAPRISFNFTIGGNTGIADLNNDGKPDIASSGGGIIINNSVRGNIQLAYQTFASYPSSQLTIGDIDGDGRQDIILGASTSFRMVVLRNTTSGGAVSFAPAVEFMAVGAPTTPTAADFDGDGKPDVAMTMVDHQMSVFKNISTPGNIAFLPQLNFSDGQYIGGRYVAAADLNGDGRPDAAVIANDNSSVSIYMNTVKPEPSVQAFNPVYGDPGTTVTITGVNFTAATAVSFGGTPAVSFVVNSPTGITAVVGTGASGSVSVSNASGTSSLPGFIYGHAPVITQITPLPGAVGSSVTINGNYFSATATEDIVFFGGVRAPVTNATVTSLTVTVPTGIINTPVTVTVNGKTAYSDKAFTTSFANPAGGFSASSFIKTDIFGHGTSNGSLADFDGDGKPDLVALMGTGVVVVSRNTSSGSTLSFAPIQSITVSGAPYMAATGDVDGNGKQDIIMPMQNNNGVMILRNQSSTGAILFAAPVMIPVILPTSHPVVAMARDMDGDGLPELILATQGSNTISVFKNQSNGTNFSFGPRLDYVTDSSPSDMDVADVDGDGKPDILVEGSNINVFRNVSNGGGLAFENRFVTPGGGGWYFSVGDIDGDGKPDIAMPGSTSFSLVRNTSTPGNISFGQRIDSALTLRPQKVALGDLDGDGKLDIIAISDSSAFNVLQQPSKMVIYKNISTPGSILVATGVHYYAGDLCINAKVGDADNDGKADVMVIGLTGFSFFRNQVGVGVTGVSLCAGTNTTLNSNVTGTTYQWQQNTGTGFANISNGSNISGATTATLVLTNVPAAWNTYQFRCQVNGGAQTSNAFMLQVTPSPTANAGPDKSFCAGSGGVQIGTAATSGGNQYSWSPTTGLTITDPVQPLANPIATTTYTLTVTNQQGCSSSSTVIVTVLPMPATPSITPAGTTNICAGNSATFTSSSATGNQWTLNGTNIAGATLASYQTGTAGTYRVKVTAGGCTSASSAAATLNVNPIPATPVITGAGSVCAGALTTFNSSAATGNQWMLNDADITGANQASYQTGTAGAYKVRATVSGCTSAPSTAVNLAVNPVPAAPVITPAGTTDICMGSTAAFTSSAASGNQWMLNGTDISGATAITYQTGTAGNYTARSTQGSCASPASAVVVLSVHAIPQAPVISQAGNVLSSSSGSGNQWYLNGTAISGATGASYTPLASGIYAVIVTQQGCVSATSNNINFVMTAINDPLLDNRMTIGPNPAHDQLSIAYHGNADVFDLTVTDIAGRRVVQNASFTTGYLLNMSAWSAGPYIITVRSRHTSASLEKLIIKN